MTPSANQTITIVFVDANGAVLGAAGSTGVAAGSWLLDTAVPPAYRNHRSPSHLVERNGAVPGAHSQVTGKEAHANEPQGWLREARTTRSGLPHTTLSGRTYLLR